MHSWVSPAHQSGPWSTGMRTRLLLSSEPDNARATPDIDIAGKTVYQRIFYRLSPLSEVDEHNSIVVEERARFKADAAKGEGYLKPIGPRTLILRDGKSRRWRDWRRGA